MLIDKEGSSDIVAQAAQSDEVESGCNVTDANTAMFEELLADNDVGVRKAAVTSIASSDRGDLKAQVQELAQGDTAEPIRDLASATAKGLKKPK